MNKKKLILARKRIDRLDNKIFNLIKKRTKIVHHMMNIKNLKKQIVDRKRINEIFKKIKKKSIKNNIDPRITSQIWKSMIWAYVKYQRRNFKKK
tara:strand:+ start:159 stop:440 length:282 start_codon:yes stop_codon:yes gene_type:complete